MLNWKKPPKKKEEPLSYDKITLMMIRLQEENRFLEQQLKCVRERESVLLTTINNMEQIIALQRKTLSGNFVESRPELTFLPQTYN